MAPEGHADNYPLDKVAAQQGRLNQVGGLVLVLYATLMTSSVNALNRSLKAIPFSVVLFYHGFVGACITFIMLFVAVYFYDRPLYFLDFSPFQNSCLFIATTLGALALAANTVAFQTGTSGFVSMCSYMNVCYALFVDLIIFHESLNLTEVIGCIAILAIVLVVGMEKIRLQKV